MPQHGSVPGLDAYGSTKKASSAQKPRSDLTTPEPGNSSQRTPGMDNWHSFKGLAVLKYRFKCAIRDTQSHSRPVISCVVWQQDSTQATLK